MPGLEHIRFLGGGTGAGKTTIARLLAERTGASIYNTDATLGAHAERLTAASAPLLDRFRQMSMDERWVQRDPAEMYRTFPWFHGEGFDLLVQDLQALPRDRITLVEGFRLLPQLVRPLMAGTHAGVWLIPTGAFRQAAFIAREPDQAFWARTSDPVRAFENLLKRDAIFTSQIASAVTRHGLNSVAADGTVDAGATARLIADRLALQT